MSIFLAVLASSIFSFGAPTGGVTTLAPLARPVQEAVPMKPFVMNHWAVTKSLADVSFLLDAPAGKDGFIRVKGEHLVKPNGERIRFWGVHLTDWSPGSILLPSKEDTPVWAATLARHGVNIVRLHFLDLASPRGIIDGARDDSRHFDPQQLDRLDFMVSELKKRGIYMDLNLNVGRSYKPGDNVRDAERLGWGKGVVYYDPRLIELQKDYAKQLLTHLNPYTSTEYRNEPAIAIVELVNENALYMGFRGPTPYYDEELTRLYNEWLAKKMDPAQLAAYRKSAGVEGAVPRLQGPAVGRASKERFETELAFYLETERGFYRDMTAYLRELGVKQPLIGTADHSHGGSSYTMLTDLKQMDIIDGHDYWEHPGSPVMNTAMVNDPFNSTIVELSRTAMSGKPYTVSETNHPFPDDYASEGIPLLASYGCLQDWDMIITYTFEPKRSRAWQPYVADPFDISQDPVKMSELSTGALIFLRGDVKVARQTIDRSYAPEQVIASWRLPGSERPYFTPGFPLALPLVHKSRIKSLTGPPTGAFPAIPAGPIVSDTGQLIWYPSKTAGFVTVDTDRTQALVGFFNEPPKPLKNLAVEISNRFATIVLSSMDGRPISRSQNLLLTTGSKVANTGMTWNPSGRSLSNWGGSPTLIEPVTGRITLREIQATSVTAYPLDGSGNAIGAGIRATKAVAGWTFPIGDPVTCWYRIELRP